MTNSTNQILVQNVETFSTIITLDSMDAFDAWLETAPYGIVSLDSDADGEYGFVALVASDAGPDYIMDSTTGEMEPVEQVDPADELAAKMDIMMEIDMNDVPQEQILAMLADEPLAPVPAPVEDIIEDEEPVVIAPVAFTPPKTLPSKSNKGSKMRNFQILASFIEANPGCSRTEVFTDQGLLQSLRTKPQVSLINNGDKAEVKRWNRRLNFLIREMRRQNVDIQIERKGRVAHYTIGKPSGQLEIPFTPAAEARNSAIIFDATHVYEDGSSARTETAAEAKTEAAIEAKFDAKRASEDPNQMMDFEALLATLDDEAVAPLK